MTRGDSPLESLPLPPTWKSPGNRLPFDDSRLPQGVTDLSTPSPRVPKVLRKDPSFSNSTRNPQGYSPELEGSDSRD